jgi:hypothetical protein
MEAETVTHRMDLAIKIVARPQDVWPWLLQLGYRRGGLYSYDWLDRIFGYLDAPSSKRILPEFQNVRVGDIIPIGRGPGFPVQAIEPERRLRLGGESQGVSWTWEFELQPIDEWHTELISRSRVETPDTVRSSVWMFILGLAAVIMTRRMLIGLKRRAEALVKNQCDEAMARRLQRLIWHRST